MVQAYTVIVSCIVFNDRGSFLLLRRSLDEDVLPGYWGVPGGKVEIGGEQNDVLEAELRREVFEEVGIEIDHIQYLQSHTSVDAKLFLFFTARRSRGDPTPQDGADRVGWFTLSDVQELELTPNLHHILRIAHE